MIEYLVNGTLRWSFGFDNPNKAAVLFACLLPILWISWDWGWRKGRSIASVAAGLLILASFAALCLTYSRGGLVATAAAFGYILYRQWRSGARPTRARLIAACILLVIAVSTLVFTGLATRSLTPITSGDASVGNRLDLWTAALAMAADRPLGFGLGNSGQAYMQWYQPLGSDAGYRTLVSGYLTPLVEFGWPLFALTILLLAAWWSWTAPRTSDRRSRPVITGFRATILAFATAAIFSTTIETPTLWILPTLAFIATTWLTIANRGAVRQLPDRPTPVAQPPLHPKKDPATTHRKIHPPTIRNLAITTTFLLALYAVGLALSATAPLQKTFGPNETVLLRPRELSSLPIGIVPDPAVLGPTYGHLLRELAIETNTAIEISATAKIHRNPAKIILSGNAVGFAAKFPTAPLTLLCPDVIPEDAVPELLRTGNIERIYLSEIDPDRRSLFWKAHAPESLIETIPGVGTRVDWAWNELAHELTR
ncbi:MAG: O-antigen ligase family protein [Chthoniobacterales bacterium]